MKNFGLAKSSVILRLIVFMRSGPKQPFLKFLSNNQNSAFVTTTQYSGTNAFK